MRYFEDLPVGMSIDLGTVSLSENDIVEFARRYDPQIFHVDPIAAESSVFGGLIASGVHTLALYMRLFVDGLIIDVASLGSPGIDELRWSQPVRAGDTLRGSYTVLSARPSNSRPECGVLVGRGQAVNQNEQLVLSMSVVNLVGRRPSGAEH